MKILDDYFQLQKEIYDYFKYYEDWVVIPIEDRRDYWWFLEQAPDGHGKVSYWENKKKVAIFLQKNKYEDKIYTQRFLPKWVYPGKDYTMICVDTQTDGNKFLSIYSNNKEIKEKEWIEPISDL